MKIGKRIRKLRTSKGLTLQELGEKVFLSHQQLSKIERGISGCDFEQVEFILKKLGVDIIFKERGYRNSMNLEDFNTDLFLNEVYEDAYYWREYMTEEVDSRLKKLKNKGFDITLNDKFKSDCWEANLYEGEIEDLITVNNNGYKKTISVVGKSDFYYFDIRKLIYDAKKENINLGTSLEKEVYYFLENYPNSGIILLKFLSEEINLVQLIEEMNLSKNSSDYILSIFNKNNYICRANTVSDKKYYYFLNYIGAIKIVCKKDFKFNFTEEVFSSKGVYLEEALEYLINF